MSEEKKPGEPAAPAAHPVTTVEVVGGLVLPPNGRELRPVVPIYQTSCDLNTPEGRYELGMALMGEGEDPATRVNTVLDVVHITRWPIEFTSESGEEIIQVVATCLHLEDGTRVIFKSDGVSKSLGVLYLMRASAPPWKPALKALLTRKPTSEGRSMYQLIYQDPAKTSDTKKKK